MEWSRRVGEEVAVQDSMWARAGPHPETGWIRASIFSFADLYYSLLIFTGPVLFFYRDLPGFAGIWGATSETSKSKLQRANPHRPCAGMAGREGASGSAPRRARSLAIPQC